MNLKITSQNENVLLDRKEITAEFESKSATPKREEIIERIAALLGVSKNLIVVEAIKQRFGSRTGCAYLKIYGSEESLKKMEPKPKEKKEQKAEAKQEKKQEPMQERK